MLIKALRVENGRGSLLNLPLDDISAGFVVKNIEGLDPVKGSLVSSSFANMDGEQYHSSRREARNIRIKMGLEPNYGEMAVKDLRDQLYDFFMPTSKAKLTFDMFDRHATNILKERLELEIEARVESFENTLFSKDPEVTISLMCFNPDFVNPIPIVFEGMTVNDQTEEILTYEGSIGTGIKFTLRPDRAMTDFAIYHQPPDGSFRVVNFTHPLSAGEVVTINSVVGSKYVTLLHSGGETHILWALSPQSNWIELQPGNNGIRVYSEGIPVPYSVEYTEKHGGL